MYGSPRGHHPFQYQPVRTVPNGSPGQRIWYFLFLLLGKPTRTDSDFQHIRPGDRFCEGGIGFQALDLLVLRDSTRVHLHSPGATEERLPSFDLLWKRLRVQVHKI